MYRSHKDPFGFCGYWRPDHTKTCLSSWITQQLAAMLTRACVWLSMCQQMLVILAGVLVSFNEMCNEVYAQKSHARISKLTKLAWSCWNQSSFMKPPVPQESTNTAKTKAGQILLSSFPPTFYSLVSPFCTSSPFPKHEQFTVNSIFPCLGSHGTPLEFRFVMIKWLHGIVFLRAPPSTFIRICQCQCRSASQSARLCRSSSPRCFSIPSWKLVIPYEIRRSRQTHNLITSVRLKIYWILLPVFLLFSHF